MFRQEKSEDQEVYRLNEVAAIIHDEEEKINEEKLIFMTWSPERPDWFEIFKREEANENEKEETEHLHNIASLKLAKHFKLLKELEVKE